MLSTIINKIRLLFSTEKESYLCFYKMLGFYPKNLKYYKQALIHKSSTIIEDNGCVQNNERLEFLGDAVLDAVVADLLFYYFKDKKEGFLTNTRSKIVQRETLNRLAIEIYGTNTYLQKFPLSLKKGEQKSLCFELDLNIGVGVYSISTALHSGNFHLENNYEWHDNAIAFEVLDEIADFKGLAKLNPKIILE